MRLKKTAQDDQFKYFQILTTIVYWYPLEHQLVGSN